MFSDDLTERSHAGDPNFMTSLERGLQVIRAFSEHRRNLTISQISQTTGLSRAAVRRCLYTLHMLGYVAEDDKRFSLKPLVLTLGQSFLSSTPLAVVAQPYLDQVSEMLRESCSVAILDGDDIVYICRSRRNPHHVDQPAGRHAAAGLLHVDGPGAARAPAAAALEAYLERVRLVARTERTVTSVAKLRRPLKTVRESGIALLDQELEVGLRSIAVPVRDVRGNVVAAMNISTHAARVSLDEMQRRFLPMLSEAARGLGAVLVA